MFTALPSTETAVSRQGSGFTSVIGCDKNDDGAVETLLKKRCDSCSTFGAFLATNVTVPEEPYVART